MKLNMVNSVTLAENHVNLNSELTITLSGLPIFERL